MGIKGKVLDTLEKKNIHITKGHDGYYTYHLRPKYADSMSVDVASDCSDVAIVIQGPIKYEDDFTIESIKYYNKVFPNSKIILATWDSENEDVLKKAESAGVIVIACSRDSMGKYQDNRFNFQICNTKAGVLKARDLGVTYIAKTRTDQRVYSPDAFDFLKKMLVQYPVTAEADAGITPNHVPQGRVIGTSLGTFTNRYYNVSDLFLFGYATDMVTMFDCPYDEHDYQEVERIKKECDEKNDPLTYSKTRSGEIYFSTHYIEQCGHELQWTMEDSLSCMADRYIIIDQEDIDLYWAKYGNKEYKWRKYRHDERQLTQMTFSKWLLMQ